MLFLPLKDENPTQKKPYFTWAIIALCAAVFFWQLSLPNGAREAILAYGVTPSALLGGESLPPELERIPAFMTIFTSMFMHGGIMHFAGNMLYFWVFGDNIEDAIGSKFRYLSLYLICGIVAALAQALVNPQSDIPMIGASGAIAGMLGAYLVLYPRANILCFVWVFIWYIPAFLVLSVWLGLQFLNLGQTGSGVAYVAHIGGFVAGMVLIPFFKKPHISLFAPANNKPFKVVRIHTAKSHIPSMVRKKIPKKMSWRDPNTKWQTQKTINKPSNKKHPWAD